MDLLNKFTNVFLENVETDALVLRCIEAHGPSKRGKRYTEENRIIGVRPLSFSDDMRKSR